jgi:hypothetical protein
MSPEDPDSSVPLNRAVLDKLDAQAVAIRETREAVTRRFRERFQAPKFADLVEGIEVQDK